MINRALIHNNNVDTKVGVGDSDKFEVNEVWIQKRMAKSRIISPESWFFVESKKQPINNYFKNWYKTYSYIFIWLMLNLHLSLVRASNYSKNSLLLLYYSIKIMAVFALWNFCCLCYAELVIIVTRWRIYLISTKKNMITFAIGDFSYHRKKKLDCLYFGTCYIYYMECWLFQLVVTTTCFYHVGSTFFLLERGTSIASVYCLSRSLLLYGILVAFATE